MTSFLKPTERSAHAQGCSTRENRRRTRAERGTLFSSFRWLTELQACSGRDRTAIGRLAVAGEHMCESLVLDVEQLYHSLLDICRLHRQAGETNPRKNLCLVLWRLVRAVGVSGDHANSGSRGSGSCPLLNGLGRRRRLRSHKYAVGGVAMPNKTCAGTQEVWRPRTGGEHTSSSENARRTHGW